MTRKSHFFIFVFLLIAGILAPVILLQLKNDQASAPPVLGKLSEFSLQDEEGTPFTEKSISGKIWVADFIFTTCAGPCPIMTQTMADLIARVSPTQNLQFVSISVNPDYDVPEILKKYGEKYHADFSRWHFLTGAMKDIHRLAAMDFKLGSVDNPVFHSDRFVLVDSKLNIRGYYDVQDPAGLVKLKKELNWLLETPSLWQSLISLF